MTTPPPSLPALQAILEEGVPLARAWGVRVLSAEGGNARLRLPCRPELLRPGQTISGPALMGLADMAMWAALLSLTGGRDESVTASMTVNFLRPVGRNPVIAEARLVKRGRRMQFGEILLRAEGGEEVCVHVTTSWAMIAPPERTA